MSDADYADIREWYLGAMRSSEPVADLIASWRARYVPTHWRSTRSGEYVAAPMVSDRRYQPPGRPSGSSEAYTLASDRAGCYLQLSDGRVLRDQDEARRALATLGPDSGQLDAMVRMLPRRRDEGSRKGRSREVVARSLAISALSASLSEHAAARMVIGWGSDLGDLRDVVGVALRGPSDAVERALIEDAEAHVLQAQRECLRGLDLLRLSDVPIAS